MVCIAQCAGTSFRCERTANVVCVVVNRFDLADHVRPAAFYVTELCEIYLQANRSPRTDGQESESRFENS